MLRPLFYLVAILALAWAAAELAHDPGEVAIRWNFYAQDYAITTSVPVLIAAVTVIAILWAVVYHLWRWLRTGPRRLRASRAARRREHGYQALTKGLVAVAAGDPKGAQRFGKASGRLLDNPLNLLVLAQAARLNGDEAAARRHLHDMLDHPETEFLGLRGLLVQATKEGDWDAALSYARRAYALSPKTEWVSGALFDLEARAGDWRAAQKTLEAATRHKHVGPVEAPRRRAVVLAERARAAHAEGRDEEALSLAREAHRLAPGLAAPTALAANLLIAAGRRQAAGKLIEKGWASMPHPTLAHAYAALAPDEPAMERVKRFERLRDRRPDHPESRIALAEAALAAELWGTARNQLEAVARERPTQRVYRLMAAVEERESGDAEAARSWLMRAASAPPDAAWLCDRCGAASAEWGARCGSCGAFDSLVWRVPPVAVEAPPVDEPPAAGGEGLVVVDEVRARK